ncbi:hypothetical protein F5Y15DRAFT_101466 [Xylariaceae sp. FL0016]|nr:hypothetical protein F5Y15DRAFT_101466 [Xylariaceae sp. FL0016]
MRVKSLLAITCLSSAVLASSDPDPTKVAKPATRVRDIKPRQSQPNLLGAIWRVANEFGLGACVPGAITLVTDLPKLPSGLVNNDLIDQALSQTTLALTDVCDFSITGSVGDVYTTFLPTWYSWYRAHSSKIANIITACPKATSLVSTVEAYETCPQVPTTTAASSATATGGSGSGSTSGTLTPPNLSATTTSTSTGAAAPPPRETGLVAAVAAAAAGFVGVVAVL